MSSLSISRARSQHQGAWRPGTPPHPMATSNLQGGVANPPIPMPDLSTLRNPWLRDDIQNLQYNIRIINDCIAKATVLTGELTAFCDDLNSEETEGKERWEALCGRYTELQGKILDFQRGPKFYASAAVNALPLGKEVDGSQANKLFKRALKNLEDGNKAILVKINEWVHKKALQFPLLPSPEEEREKSTFTHGLAFSGASLLSALCLNPVVAPALRNVSLGILNSQLLQDHILNSSYPAYTLGALAMAYPTYLGAAKLANFAKSWIGPTLSAIASSIKSPVSKALALSTEYPITATLLTYGTIRQISPFVSPHLAPYIDISTTPYLSTFGSQMISSAALISLANCCHARFFANNPSEIESAPLRPVPQPAAPSAQSIPLPASVPPARSPVSRGKVALSSSSSSSGAASSSKPSSSSAGAASSFGSSSSAPATVPSSSKPSSSSAGAASSSGSSSSVSTTAASSSSKSSSSSAGAASSSGFSSPASTAAATSSSSQSFSSASSRQTWQNKLAKQLDQSEETLEILRKGTTRFLRSTAGG